MSYIESWVPSLLLASRIAGVLCYVGGLAGCSPVSPSNAAQAPSQAASGRASRGATSEDATSEPAGASQAPPRAPGRSGTAVPGPEGEADEAPPAKGEADASSEASSRGTEVPEAQPSAVVDPRTLVASDSWGVCRLLAPTGLPGIGGSDLGFSVLSPMFDDTRGRVHDRLVLLFGDTWSKATDTCFFPRERSDDLQATLPAMRPPVLSPGPPTAGASQACLDLEVAVETPEEPTTWRPIRLFGDAGERSDENLLDTTFLRTPVTGFSDGEHTFGVFLRSDAVSCEASSDCPHDATCSTDVFPRPSVGACEGTLEDDALPAYCVRPSRCADGTRCVRLPEGVCMANRPLAVPTDGGAVSPPWFENDPRHALLAHIYIGAALWPDRPEDYAVGHRFATQKFVNSVARTVAFFDPDDPSANDYRPGHHTLLMWGRPSFAGGRGVQSPLFLLHQPLEGLLNDDGTLNWAPRFFAGYDPATGKPRWSSRESEALPVYGMPDSVDAAASGSISIDDFDLVNHGAVTWVEALERWVLFYGGSVPEWLLADRATGTSHEVVRPQPLPGAIHMRSAAHPWGQATRDAPEAEAWSEPEPVLAPDSLGDLMRCDDPNASSTTACTVPRSPAELASQIVTWATEVAPENWQTMASVCMVGNLVLSYLYQLDGSDSAHLYGTNIIGEWTEDVTDSVEGLDADERAVEIYWNVSTWKPYQVLLLKTQLRARVRP